MAHASMEQTVDELKKAVDFKETTVAGDIVLMVNETGEADGPLGFSYAVVTGFVRDDSKRDEWWFVHLSFLTVPPSPQVLILQSDHFTGQEIFTIGGRKVFIKALDFRPPAEVGGDETGAEPSAGTRTGPGLRVVK